MSNNPNSSVTTRKKRRSWWIAAVLIVVAAAAAYYFKSPGKTAGNGATFAAKRGPLDITVLEGGSLKALESQEAKCEVRVGYQGTKILKIVEEGYLVSEDDVKNGKVLVELDSSELLKQITQQEIQFQTAAANLTDAQQTYAIQLIQNRADINAAEQKTRFARMDFDKFLGDTVTQEIIDQLGLEKDIASQGAESDEATRAFSGPGNPPVSPPPGGTEGILVVAAATPGDVATVVTLPEGVQLPPAAVEALQRAAMQKQMAAAAPATSAPPPAAPVELPKSIVIDFTKFATLEALGDGEAKQKLRKFEDDFQVAQKELGQAKATREGTQRLFEKGFVTRTEQQRDEISHENTRLKVQTAETARALFLKYEFIKSGQEMLSKYADAVREWDKAKRSAISKSAQAEARLKSAQGQYNIQLRQRKDLNDQLEKCTIRAQKPGLVVYGGARDDMYYYGGQEPIREGASVRERQAIITIPDLTKMAVNVKIHETYIKKVTKGQKVRITVDAFPDKILEGEVSKVGVLPDSQNRWMNPDLKVYLTEITIAGTHAWIKPGMSAKAEIFVDRLADVVYVPVQSVVPSEGKQICYVATGFRSERREVEIGQFNDAFIEIKSGLKDGETVLLRPPESTEPAGGQSPAEPGKDKATPPAAPAQTTAVRTGSA